MSNAHLRKEQSERVADILVDCLKHFLGETALHERSVAIETGRVEAEPYQDAKGAIRNVPFYLPDGQQVNGALEILNRGGNIYDIRVELDGGKVFRLDVCVPKLDGSSEEMQRHTEKVCRRLLAELERIDGERTLQSATQREETA